MHTDFAPRPQDEAFVAQLLGTGNSLATIVERFTDALVEKGSTTEDASAEVIGALAGSMLARLTPVPEAEIARATEIIELALDGVLADLDLALARARRFRRRRGARRRRPD